MNQNPSTLPTEPTGDPETPMTALPRAQRKNPYLKPIVNPATNLRALRRKAKLTQGTVATAAGLSLGVVHRVEHATTDAELDLMSVGNLIRIADALDVTPSRLYPRLAGK